MPVPPPRVIPESLDYAAFDFESLRLRLYNLIGSVFPQWTDREIASLGNLLVELMAFTGDVLGFYLDASARESKLATATLRQSIIHLARQLGYRPASNRIATVAVTLSTAVDHADLILLPPDPTNPARRNVARCATVGENKIEFQLLAVATLSTGGNSVVATFEHATSHMEQVGSSGKPLQSFTLDRTPYVDGTLAVTDISGQWTEQETLLDSGPTDRHYTVLVDHNDRATVAFGDGVLGAIPKGQIRFVYKTGGGAAGNVSPGTITKVTGSFTDQAGRPIPLTCTNAQAASGGIDRESGSRIKLLAPLARRAPRTTVAREDFEIHALLLAGVGRALMLTSNEDAGIDENTGQLYIVPAAGGALSPALQQEVVTQVTETYPTMPSFEVSVIGALYKTVNVYAVIHPAAGASGLRDAIVAALTEFFRPTTEEGTPNTLVDFGWNMQNAQGVPDPALAISDVRNVVRDVAGVRKLGAGSSGFTLNGADADVVLRLQEFPVLGEVTLVNGDNPAVPLP